MDDHRVCDERAIERLIAEYGHLLDEKRWDDLDTIFLEDAIFDATESGYFEIRGIADIRRHWDGPDVRHPIGHHATNVLVTLASDDEATVKSKGISVFAENDGYGPVSSVVYKDIVRRTPAGWRIAVREAIRRIPGQQ
jgi:hypothetical protein